MSCKIYSFSILFDLMSEDDKPEVKEMINAIIQSQCDGGCTRHEPILSIDWEIGSLVGGSIHDVFNIVTQDGQIIVPVMQIVLDTEGSKAAYIGWMCEDCGNGEYGFCHDDSCSFHIRAWRECGHIILDDWNSDKGNNMYEAVKKAFTLLPSKE